MVFGKAFVRVSLLGAALCQQAYGFDFDRADELFAQRAEGQSQALEARKAYEGALSESLTDSEKVYAVSQMGRLDIVRAMMIPGLNLDQRKAVLEECAANSEKIAGPKVQPYYYFKSACLAFRAKLAEENNEVLKYALMLRKIKEDILNASKDEAGNSVGGFEGGGCLRVLAGVYSNAKAKLLGLFKPEYAEELAELAIQSKAQLNKPFPVAMSGSDYYENFYFKAYALLGRAIGENNASYIEKAKSLLESTDAKIASKEEDEDLPAGRELETKYYHRQIQGLRAVAEKCNNEGEFAECLLDGLKELEKKVRAPL